LKNQFVDTDSEDFVYELLASKFLCCIVLHVQLQPKVAESLERLKYINRHPYKFDRITIPILISYLKLFIELLNEGISFLICATRWEPVEVVFNYVAIIIISELDEVYYSQINTLLKEEF